MQISRFWGNKLYISLLWIKHSLRIYCIHQQECINMITMCNIFQWKQLNWNEYIENCIIFFQFSPQINRFISGLWISDFLHGHHETWRKENIPRLVHSVHLVRYFNSLLLFISKDFWLFRFFSPSSPKNQWIRTEPLVYFSFVFQLSAKCIEDLKFYELYAERVEAHYVFSSFISRTISRYRCNYFGSKILSTELT